MKFARSCRLLFALLLAPLACSDPPKPSTTQTAPKPKEEKKSRKGAAKGAAAPADTAPPPPKMDFQDEDFVESEQNRDPFRSFAELFAGKLDGPRQGQRRVVLEAYSIDELKLVGIVSRINPAKAMLVDPQGQGHVVHRGDFVGKAERVQAANADADFELNWRIERIRDADLVLVREDPSNPDVPSAMRVIALRPEDAPSE